MIVNNKNVLIAQIALLLATVYFWLSCKQISFDIASLRPPVRESSQQISIAPTKPAQEIVDKPSPSKESVPSKPAVAPAPDPTPLPMLATPGEKALWTKYVSQAKSYFEYGMGGSTYRAITELKVPKICAVDSAEAWVKNVQDSVETVVGQTQTVSLRWIDLGPIGSYGTPKDKENHGTKWPNYPNAVKDEKTLQSCGKPDVVFVDGRFRIACTLVTLLNTAPGTVIILHDFNDRPHYHKVLPHLQLLEKADTLSVFIAKPDMDKVAVQSDLDRWMMDVS